MGAGILVGLTSFFAMGTLSMVDQGCILITGRSPFSCDGTTIISLIRT